LASLNQGPVHRRRVHLARDRVPGGVAADIVGCRVYEDNAMLYQKLVGRGAVVGKGPDYSLKR
jgi:hypothetical protein